MGYRRFLEADYKWRVNKTSFNKSVERRPPPVSLTGHDILDELSGVKNVFGRDVKGNRKKGERYLVYQWKKRASSLNFPIGGIF